jgi:hypothetical protein
MNRFKLAGVMLGALFVLAAMATSASAFTLPDVSVTLTGGVYPLHLNSNLPTTATVLSAASGSVLTGVGTSTLLLATELSALGTFASTFLNVINGVPEKCTTGTEAPGVVKLSGEYHVVPINATGKLGELFLVSEFVITCGTEKVTIRGSVLGSISAGTENQELTSTTGVLLSTETGKQELSEYINDTGSIVKAHLEADAGLEFVTAGQNVGAPATFEALGSQMFVITGR